MLRNIVIPNRYVDSVMLMSIAARAKEASGAGEVSAMMGTDANKELLAASGVLDDAGAAAGPMDLIIAVRAEDEARAESAAAAVQEFLLSRPQAAPGDAQAAPPSLAAAARALPEANLVFISVPGPYARREAEAALDRGMHVMIFSDNVPIEDEVALKRKADRLGLIVMGPDCGTAIIGGVALGFANVVNRGPVGIVGAAGTGIQEVSCIVSNRGLGISHAIGLGGRDLGKEVGGISMCRGIDLLDADPATKLIVLVSKPPDRSVAARVLDHAAKCATPAIVCFMNGDPAEVEARGLRFCPTLESAALAAVEAAGGKAPPRAGISDAFARRAEKTRRMLDPGQRYIRGLFSGGTLTDEALLVLNESVGRCRSNTPLVPEMKLADAAVSVGHCLVDLGDDEFTRGRPHPMIDFTLRCERIVREAGDPETALILFDVVLGYGAHPDPAGALVPAIEAAQARAGKRRIAFVASVTGTDADPQCRSRQRAALEQAGVIVTETNAEAARLAGLIVSR
ncbi:MAG TPA: acyl-CoA synthetase FdrA [bacterium]|nr:acyl-CoA synthetase FdrA [Chlamydiota bacterium]HOE28313.1 acyl-CoA synthetase FdrA [bacterium]HQM52111.1 acyl-CoA synthetase FdrA [bacterium]